jgi:hypothetical protein
MIPFVLTPARKEILMNHRLRVFTRSVATLACVLSCAPSLFAQDADIVGNWDVTVTAGQGPATSTPIVLKREGDQIVGTFSSPQGDHSVEAAVKDREVPAGTQAKDSPLDVSGTWTFQVEIGGTTGTPTMTFKQEGEKLSGRYSGQLGEAPLTGTLKGNAIEFSFDVTIEGNAVRIVYAGTVEKDSMKGTAKFGDFGEGAFTGKRKP